MTTSCRATCYPPVTLMWRLSAGRLWRRSMMKSWPLGLREMASTMAAFEQLVAFGGAQRRPEIGGILLAEAHEERAGAGQPHPVAAFAEIVGHRRDEAEPPAGLLHPHIARRPAGAIADILEREALRQPRAHQR